MLPSFLTSLRNTVDATRQAALVCVWETQTRNKKVSYFYGYWFSHWRA